MAIALLHSGPWRGKRTTPTRLGFGRLRHLALRGLFASALLLPGAAIGQALDQREIEAHLAQMYQGHGEVLLTWKRPIYYIVAGLDKEQELKRSLDYHFTYLAALTGLEIQEADPTESKGNFILVFANPISQIAPLKTLRSIFGEDSQSDAEYLAMLEDMERRQSTKFVTNRTEDSILFTAVLANPTSWDYDLVSTQILQLIVVGLTKTDPSNKIRPSIWNSVDNLKPINRLPSIDEAYLRALHRRTVESGVPIEDGIRDLAAAIASNLKNQAQ